VHPQSDKELLKKVFFFQLSDEEFCFIHDVELQQKLICRETQNESLEN